jgi:hypothetical protein
MARLTKISVVDENTLRLEEDAKAGDTIDLKELQQVDVSYLHNAIENGLNRTYREKMDAEKKNWELEKDQALKDAQHDSELREAELKNQISNLKNEQESINKEAALSAQSSCQKQIADLEAKLNSIENQKRLEAEKASAEFQARKAAEIAALKETFQREKEQLDQQISAQKDTINQKEITINTLNNQKAATGVKVLGEQLESWCNQEYQNYALTGFKDCTWDKDNTLVNDEGEENRKGGTKADYIFRSYDGEIHDESHQLTSVCMDMKNEDPLGKSKKHNEDFYKKLDSDRTKKGCEYALLVSELDMDYANNAPIVKVNDYPKMYMVRPPYLFAFLSVLVSLGEKYKALLNEDSKAKLEFKDSQDILTEFDELKNTYLDKPLLSLENQIQEISKEADKICTSGQKIKDSSSKIINDTLEAIRGKIEKFDITKISRKAAKLEEK